MKNRKCPNHKACWDYGSCEDCELGKQITRLHKRIDRLKKQNETLTIQRNAWALAAKAVLADTAKKTLDAVRSRATRNAYSCMISGGIRETYTISGKALEEIEKELLEE